MRLLTRDLHTFPVLLCAIVRETVTVAVLFMKPTFVTMPVNAMGGMLSDEREDHRVRR